MEEDDLIKITPDKERVKSILGMVYLREKRIQKSEAEEFATLLVEDYYEIIKELATAILNLNGYKTLSHKALFEFLKDNYSLFTLSEIELMDELRKIRNKVVYEGFFVKGDYLKRNKTIINSIMSKTDPALKRGRVFEHPEKREAFLGHRKTLFSQCAENSDCFLHAEAMSVRNRNFLACQNLKN